MDTRVIFSIDNASDLRTLARFLRYVDEKRALGYLKETFDLCVGSWKGQLEYSFVCSSTDFVRYFKESSWLKNQEAYISFDDYSADLVSTSGVEHLGTPRYVEKKEAEYLGDYTYFTKSNLYLIIQ